MKRYLILELKYNIKKLEEYIYIYVFFTISLFMLWLNMSSVSDTAGLSGWLPLLVLFSSILAAQQWWAEDAASGVLDQWRLSAVSMETIVIAKLMIYLFSIVLPLAIISVGFVSLAAEVGWELMGLIILLLGAQMGSIAMLAAALTRGEKQHAGVLAAIIMPLCIPSLLFASRALETYGLGTAQDDAGALWLLAGYAGFTIPMACIATAANLRQGN